MRPTACAASRTLPLEAFPGRLAVVCARCRACLREGDGPAEEAWCAGPPVGAPAGASGGNDAGPPPDGTLDDPEAAPRAPVASTVGRWRLLGALGVGGAGIVYRAWDTVLERPVALKLLSAGMWATPAALGRFRREAKAAGQLGIPGVVRVLDVGTSADGAPWLAMELVEGPSLAAVRMDGPLDARRAATFGRAVARTLATVHAAGLAHRDVKPSNIVLDPRGNPVLVDFGLVVPLEDGAPETRGQVGTPGYMAPEQLGDARGVDWRRVDIYALGRVLGELCPEPPSDLAAIVARAAAADPEDRYPDAGALADDLDAFLAGRAPSVRRGGALDRAGRFVRRQRKALALAGCVLLALGLAGAAGRAWQVHARRAERAAREADLAARLALLLPEMDRLDAAGGDGASLLSTLVEDPANARTAARAVAWGTRARHRHDAGRLDDAREAWARAILLARRPADRVAGLLGLVDTLAAARQWAALSRTLELLDVESPGAIAVDAPVRVRLAVATGDLAAAARIVDPADAAFLGAWSTATRLADDGRSYLAKPGPAGGGRQVIYLARFPDGALLAIDAEGVHVLDPRDGCAADTVYVSRDDPAGARLVGLYPDGFADCGPVGIAGASPTRIGEELYLPVGGYTRKLYVRPFAGGVPRLADADTDALQSYVLDVAEMDADADGVDELVIATGPPLGYGLRVFDRHAPDADGDTLTLRARGLLGMPTAVKLLAPGWLIAGTTTERPSRYVFGDDAPDGVPPGLHLLHLVGDRLDVVAHWANPRAAGGGTSTWSAPLWVGDADGDGLPDVAATHVEPGRATLGLYRGRAGHDLDAWLLEGWRVLAAAQLDDDPAPEILATYGVASTFEPGPLYVIGLGADPLPRLDLGRPASEVPADGPPELLFARLGLHDSAARALERSAGVAPAPSRSSLYALAAEEWERAGEPAAAGAAWDAAKAGAADPDAMAGRARAAWIAAGGFDAARAEGDAGAGASADEAAAVHDLSGPGVAIDLTRPDPAWQLTPGLAGPNLHAGSLDLVAIGGVGRLARLPLARTGDAVRLRLTLQVTREEWAAGFAIALRSGAGPDVWWLRSHAGGGGGLLARQQSTADCGDSVPAASADGTSTLTYDIALSATRGWFALARDGVEIARCSRPIDGVASTDWELTVDTADDTIPGPLARGAITGLTVWGLAPRVDRSVLPTREPPLVQLRADPGATDLHDPIAAFAALRRAWEPLAAIDPADPELASALDRMPDPTPWIARSTDARWIVAARGRSAWARGQVARATTDLAAALAGPPTAEWEVALAAHATLAEIALAEGNRDRAVDERRRAVAAAPTAEVGELSLRRFARLAELAPVD